MLNVILMIALLAVIALLIYASTRPSTFRTQRSTTIKAPADKIFTIINDHQNWAAWSPWAKLDPNMKTSISTPSSGVGATYAWEGNAKAGAGRVTIVETVPPHQLESRLEMLKPFKAENKVEFTLKPESDDTSVTWAMSGKQNLLMKLVGLFIDCNDMVGKHFEAGLANLKMLAESDTEK